MSSAGPFADMRRFLNQDVERLANAPEPTTLARTVWVGVSIVLVAAMVGAHQIAAAWVDWSSRGAAAHESERE